MSLGRFVGLLLFISIAVRKGLGQNLEPRCSNLQGIYVTEEGSAVEVCFTVFQGFVAQMVTFAIESTSNLGTAAIGRLDFMNDTVSVNISPIDQDVIELCPVIEIFNDGVIERTEYFTVSLRVPEGADLASCQVAIIDTDGGPTDCYGATVTEVSLAQVIDDRMFCFTGKSMQCLQELNPNITTANDCTRWNQTAIKNILSTDSQILPSISNNIGRECIENVLSAVASLYGTKIPEDGDLRQECATNCVLTVRNSKTCDISVLLLEQVFRREITNFMNDLRTKQTSDECTIGLECCDQSQPLPSICGESPADPLPVTVVTLQTVETTTVQGTSVQVQASIVPLTIVTIIAAVLGSILGLILVGGAVALITCLVMRRRKLHKDSVAAIQVDIGDHQMKSQDSNEYATIVDRESAVMMKDNSAYMCSSQTHGQDISTDYNVAYYSSNRVKSEDDRDNVYEYI